MCSFSFSALFESVSRFILLLSLRFIRSSNQFFSYSIFCHSTRYILFKVLLDKLALDKEKHTLLQENQQLRAVLKQYLDGMFLYFNLIIKQVHNF